VEDKAAWLLLISGSRVRIPPGPPDKALSLKAERDARRKIGGRCAWFAINRAPRQRLRPPPTLLRRPCGPVDRLPTRHRRPRCAPPESRHLVLGAGAIIGRCWHHRISGAPALRRLGGRPRRRPPRAGPRRSPRTVPPSGRASSRPPRPGPPTPVEECWRSHVSSSARAAVGCQHGCGSGPPLERVPSRRASWKTPEHSATRAVRPGPYCECATPAGSGPRVARPQCAQATRCCSYCVTTRSMRTSWTW